MGLETRAAGRQGKSGGSAKNGQKDIFASKKESSQKESSQKDGEKSDQEKSLAVSLSFCEGLR